MIENYIKDTPLFLFVLCYDSVIALSLSVFTFMNMPHFPIKTVLDSLGVILLVLRIIPAFVASAKAYRDRKKPEEGKK
jgi:hypothetical protein